MDSDEPFGSGAYAPPEMDFWVISVMKVLRSGDALPLEAWLAAYKKENPTDDSQTFIIEILKELKSCAAEIEQPWSPLFVKLIHNNPTLVSQIRKANFAASFSARPFINSEEDTALAGEEFGFYKVQGFLGKGAQGSVYRAFHHEDDCSYAVKIFDSKNKAIPEAANLAREANRLQSLPQHESLVPFKEFFPSQHGNCLAIHFVKGASLEKRCERSPPSIEIAIEWVWRISDALDCAHRVGIYHRDIKPSNVLVENESGIPKLIDFGLGFDDNPLSKDRRRPLKLVGTNDFLAPEIAWNKFYPERGKRKIVPQLVDVFGLGALLYFLATGVAPFKKEGETTALNRAADCDIDRVLLSSSSLLEPLQQVCLQALSPDPNERYASVRAFQKALELAAPSFCPTPTRIEGVPSRYRSIALLLLAVTISTVISVSVLFPYFVPTKQQIANMVAQELAYAPATKKAFPEWRALALEQGIDLESISKSDFSIKIQTGKRGTEIWSTRTENDESRGNIRISTPPYLADISESIQYRIGKQSWAWTTLDLEANDVYGLLTSRDVEVDGPLEIRIGGTQEWAGGYVVGPFQYPISVQDQIALDESLLLKEQTEAASVAECFNSAETGWSLLFGFESKYGSIIKAMRFGRTRETMDHVARSGGPAMTRRTNTNYSHSNNRNLKEAFAAAARDIQDANVLWRQLEFIDGSISKPAYYRQRNRFGHDGSVRAAKELLEEMDPLQPKGLMRGRSFVLDGLACVAGALSHVEYGEAATNMDYVCPVKMDYQGTGILPSYDGSVKNYNRLALFKHKRFDSEEDAGRVFRVYDGVSLAPVLVPPLWSRIYFRGRYTNGTVTPTYSTANESIPPGFSAELIKVNSGNIALPVFVMAAFESGMGNPIRKNSFSLEDFPRLSRSSHEPAVSRKKSRLDDLFIMTPHQWPLKIELFVLPSPGIKTVRYYKTERLRDKLWEISPGTLYASFFDQNDRRIGSCAYRIDQEKLESIIARARDLSKQ